MARKNKVIEIIKDDYGASWFPVGNYNVLLFSILDGIPSKEKDGIIYIHQKNYLRYLNEIYECSDLDKLITEKKIKFARQYFGCDCPDCDIENP